MKKLLVISALLTAFASCSGNQSANNNETTGDTNNSAGLTNPSAIDTTKHPDGTLNSSVISTDTAAMNVQNSIDKAKQSKK